MLEFSPEFKAHISPEATRLCWCWRVTRADGIVMGFTDHDRDLFFDGQSYQARSGFTPSQMDSKLGFATDNSAVEGVLSSDLVTQDDIEAGLYASAQVLVLRVKWDAPETHAQIWRGNFGRIVKSGESFQIDLVGQSAILNRSTGRVFSSLCDARFADKRCTLNAADYRDGTVCPRTFEACKNTFSNTVNFRGFPYLIGDDAMQIGPDGYTKRDGSSRYS